MEAAVTEGTVMRVTEGADTLAVGSPVARSSNWRFVLPLFILAVLIGARILAYCSAGGLWRDEVHSVDMANLPSSELYFALTHDSFPVLWAIILRTWISVFGDSDASVRTLGLLISLAILPAIWWTIRQFGMKFPCWCMVLLGLDPSLIVFGGEVRGYGLGILTFLVLVGTSWSTLKKPTKWGWIRLAVAALLAVQASYTNCFMLAATFLACGFVALRRRRFRVCMGFAISGILSAISMLPYALYVLPGMSDAVKPMSGQFSMFFPPFVFLQAYWWGGAVRCVVWPLIGLLGFVEILARLNLTGSAPVAQTADELDLATFLPPFVWIGTAGFWFYMHFLGVPTQVWYYMPWLALLAVTADICLQLWSRRRQLDHLSVAVATVVCGLILFAAGPAVRCRLTSMDLVAADLNEQVRAQDLVVVFPWYLGTSFHRYYRGPAKWMNFPDVDRDGRHRGYPELKKNVMPLPTPLAVKDEIERMEAVIHSGGRVWTVSLNNLPETGTVPTVLSGAPHPKYGWSESHYMKAWAEQVTSHLDSMGASRRSVSGRRKMNLNPHENPVVNVFEPSLQASAQDANPDQSSR